MEKSKYKKDRQISYGETGLKEKPKKEFQEDPGNQILKTPNNRSDHRRLVEKFFHKVRNEIAGLLPGNLIPNNPQSTSKCNTKVSSPFFSNDNGLAEESVLTPDELKKILRRFRISYNKRKKRLLDVYEKPNLKGIKYLKL